MLILNVYSERTDGGDRLHFLYADAPQVTVRLIGTAAGWYADLEVTCPEGVLLTGAAEGYPPAPLPGLPRCKVALLDTKGGRAKLGLVLPDDVKVYRGSLLRKKAGV